jgi:RNA 3'-phosphate cyclase
LIEIDGSKGEGGGQMLRTAVALSALTGQETRVVGIRAGRPNPGLQAQHVCAIEGVSRLCDARVDGNRPGSSELGFRPGMVRAGRYRMSVGTAGSVTLVLQACLLASARCHEPSAFEVDGGTNVRWSPPIDFYQGVLFPHLARMGAGCVVEERRRGFYPEGGGKVVVGWRPPQRFQPLVLEHRGGLRGIEGTVFTQNLPEHVGQRMGAAVRKAFLGEGVSLRTERSSGPSAGAGVFLLASYEGGMLSADALGERGVPAERVGEAAARALKADMSSPATMDQHAADQLLPYMGLAQGESRFLVREVTGHLRSQAELVRTFLAADVSMEPCGEGVEVRVRPQPYM